MNYACAGIENIWLAEGGGATTAIIQIYCGLASIPLIYLSESHWNYVREGLIIMPVGQNELGLR